MSKVLIEEQTLYDIGDAIREALDEDTTYKPGEMATAINRFSGDPYANYLFYGGPGLTMLNDSSKVNCVVYPLVNRLYLSAKQDGAGSPLVNSTTEYFDGNMCRTFTYLYRDGFRIGGGIFEPKITAGTYSKLMIDIKCEKRNTGWYQEHINFSTSPLMNSNSDPTAKNIIKHVYLVNSDMTVENLNAQSGVVATRTDNVSLPRQTVEIDVSDITEDFYVSFYNCDVMMSIYAMWFE